MATTPTNNAVPSESPRDLKFNAGKIDEFVNQMAPHFKYTDRFGNEHLTIAGIENLVRQIVGTLGFVPFGTFESGATLTDATQTLKYEADGNYYRWDGDFDKFVPAGSTPDSTGGVAHGAWVNVTDLTLRTALTSSDEGKGVSLVYGAAKQTDIDYLKYRKPVFAIDYLPEGFVTDGSVNYINEIQNAISDAANKNLPCILPSFPILIDVSVLPITNAFNSGLEVPSHSTIIGGDIRLAPNPYGGYGILWMENVINISIDGTKITGDKYTHTGTGGEWGMGITIRGACDNIRIRNSNISSCWGDNLYVGQIESSYDSVPKNIYLDNITLDKGRRQGFSIIAAENLFVNGMHITGTRSSDSSTILSAGPHAGIDIEPNSSLSKLKNIVFNGLTGGDNDGGLFYVFLGSVATDYNSANGDYEFDVTVNGMKDNASTRVINLPGLPSGVPFSGAMVFNNPESHNATQGGIWISNWYAACNLPLKINSPLIKNWRNTVTTISSARRAPIGIEATSAYPGYADASMGNIEINNSYLYSQAAQGTVVNSGVVVQKQAMTATLGRVSITFAEVKTNQSPFFYQVSDATKNNIFDCNYGNWFPRGTSTTAHTEPSGAQGDLSLSNSGSTALSMVMYTPTAAMEGNKGRYLIFTGNWTITSPVDMFLNGVAVSAFTAYTSTKHVTYEIINQRFYFRTLGPVLSSTPV